MPTNRDTPPQFSTSDREERRRLIWQVAHTYIASDIDTTDLTDSVIQFLRPFDRDVDGEEYHRCYCKRGFDHVSDL